MDTVSGIGFVGGGKSDRPDAAIDDRIRIIYENLELIQNDILVLRHADQRLGRRIDQMKTELQETADAVKEDIRRDHARLHSKGFVISVGGLVCILFGIIASTYPVEITWLVLRMKYTWI